MVCIIEVRIEQKEGEGLTVRLLESLSDWEPWAAAPFDPCPPPPANTKANKEYKHNDSINIQTKLKDTDSNDNFTCYKCWLGGHLFN